MQEDLLPTFKRLKTKHPSAEMKWFQNGRLWNSRLEAQDAMRERGERGRAGDVRQGGFRERKRLPGPPERPAPREPRDEGGRLEWKPKGEFTPAPKRSDRPIRPERPAWKPKSASARPPSSPPGQRRKLDWTPKSGHAGARPAAKPGEKRKWIPKEEYQKASGATPPRDKNWRPGGEHKDPRQKYKDAKKAKWQRFKKTIRTRWDAKHGSPPPKKRRDGES